VLIPDLQGSSDALGTVLASAPDVVNHNVETVPSLYPCVRPGADYGRSIRLLECAKRRGFVTKSGIMLGLGEGMDEVRIVLQNLRNTGCDILTIGQYLRPSLNHLPVERYYRPEADRFPQGRRGSAREEFLSGRTQCDLNTLDAPALSER
jgi:lipoic acid synthetase